MPTMIQRFQCGACEDVYQTSTEAGLCYFSDTSQTPMSRERPEPQVITLDLWECDGEDCQNAFDSQWYAEQCEAGHETADAEGKPNGMIADMGERLCAMGLTQAGNIFRTVGR